MNSYGKAVLAALSILCLGACGGEESTAGNDATATSLTTNSAGVSIVASPAPAWPEGTGWRLADGPYLDVGSMDGQAETQFFRVSDGVVLSDGGFVVSSFGSHDLRRFGPSGEHVWTAGREGDGPGEFRGVTTLNVGVGDTLLTYDFRQRRIARWTPDGTFVEANPLEGVDDGGFPLVDALLPDGEVVYTFRRFGAGDPPKPGEVSRYPIEVRVGAPGDTAVSMIGEFPGRETVIMRESPTADGIRLIQGSPPFSRVTTTASDENGVWVGDSDRPDILRYGLDGTLQMIVRLRLEPVAVTPELVALALDTELEDADDELEEDLARQRWEELPLPESLPYFEELEVDRAGNLWVRAYQAPGDEARAWHVISAGDGSWLGTVTFPDRVSPLEIGEDYVLARYGDELDVEHIQMWELIKP